MNFIAGSLLYHAEEYITFWVLADLFEFLEMRDIFIPSDFPLSLPLLNLIDLPGLSKHCQIIDILMFKEQNRTYSSLVKPFN